MARPEVWTTGIAWPGAVERAAARAEGAGFDGLAVVDSQNLAGDPWVGLALAARETERLRLGTAVTNPVTRHPAVTAAAAVTLQVASAGRFVLGIGRGDSALAHLGRAPASVATFERYLLCCRPTCAATTSSSTTSASTKASPLPSTRSASPTRPLEPSPFPPAGPAQGSRRGGRDGTRVLAAAARHADRVLLALGADPDRVRWGIETVRAAGGTSIGSFVNVVTHPDVDVARRAGQRRRGDVRPLLGDARLRERPCRARRA